MSKHPITVDTVLSKSRISETIREARKEACKEERPSLANPKRPDTPAQHRHLFSGGEYSGNRPGSAYNVESLLSQVSEDLNRDLASSFINDCYRATRR